MTDNIDPPAYTTHRASDTTPVMSKTDSPPSYDVAVSSSRNATPQQTASQTPHIHHKAKTNSQQPSLSETPLQWAEPHEGDDERTAMLREFAKSKLYTFDNAKSFKGGLNW